MLLVVSSDTPKILELCPPGCDFPASGVPQYPQNDSWVILDLSEGAPLARCGPSGVFIRSAQKPRPQLPCAAFSRGPTTCSTWEFKGIQWLIGSMTKGYIFCDMKQERPATQRSASTNESPSEGPILEVHLSSSRIVSQITAYRNVTLKWTPKPVQQCGSFPRNNDPGAEREHRGPIRPYSRGLEHNEGVWPSGTVQEWQTEGTVEPCHRGGGKRK